MEKRDGFKRVCRGLRCSPKDLATASASTTSATTLEHTYKENGESPTDNRSQDAPGIRDLWDLALEKLSLEDKEAMSPMMLNSKLDKLDLLRHLHNAAVKKRIECENRRWKLEVNGRRIILRDVAEKIIFWIDKFKQIGDIAVNFDPVHASLPWAGIRFLLEMTVAESQQMGALLTGVEKITSVIGRCHIYEAFYLKREQSKQEQWRQAVLGLTSALVSLYATMLSFLGSAIRAYHRGTISRTLRAILNPVEVIGFLNKCQILENDVAREVDNCERIHSRRTQTNSEEQIQKLERILASLQTPILRIDSRVASVCERMNSSERVRMLEWISGICYEENHFFARQGRTSGTGEWLLQDKRYREWRASSASVILWLHGDPGAGKTKLVSTVVDDLLEAFDQLPNDEALAYFYCDRNQSERREPALILSSFIRQLSTSRNNDAIPSSTVQMYNQKQKTAFASGRLKLEECQAVLAELFQIYPQTTLVVDALDECNQTTRLDFMSILDKLIAESPKPVKMLVSSRRDTDIKRHFENGPNLEIRAINNQDDIEMFVNHEIAASEKFWDYEISSELKGHICNTLVKRSGGMFQWVALQIAALRELCCEQDVRNRLGRLPETLKKAYDELYEKIQSSKGIKPMIASRAFQWVMCSCWPLSPAELVAAVCQDPDTDEVDEVHININIVLDACQNLLVVDHELNVCRFSHLSVQEYLETLWTSHETDCLVGKVCLSLLINNPARPEQETQVTKREGRDKGAHDVLEYACHNWVTHIQRLEETKIFENRLTILLKRFLGSMDRSSSAYRNWYEMVERSASNFSFKKSGSLYEIYGRLSPCSQASFAIVTFGFYNALLDWWAVGFADANQKNDDGESLLQLGAIEGFVSIVKDLLKQGADVDAEGAWYGNALCGASSNGHALVVQLLLDKGANVNASGGESGSALNAASYDGHNSIVQLLLDKGADINASGGELGSALQAASSGGHESTVQLLLDNGADVNASGGAFGNALQAVSYYGHHTTIQLLLDNGADVNASGGEFGSALQAASYYGHQSIIQLLLDRKADVNASGGTLGSALQAASYYGHHSTIQLLLDKEADVNASGGLYGSALDIASSRGHKAVVQLLQAAMIPR